MSDELRLPDELAACEARLAAQSLPASRLDRDELLYRAGWAAAEARLAALNPPPSKGWEQPSTVAGGDRAQGGSSREATRGGISTARVTAAWSLTSAAIAASLAVIITLQWRPVVVREIAVDRAGPRPPLASTTAHLPDGPNVESNRTAWPVARSRQIDVGIFGLRRQALNNIWGEPINAVALTADSATPAAKTARELLEELLPAKTARPTKIWPWGNSLLGGSI